MIDVDLADGVGAIAAVLSAVSLVPQLWKTWQTRSADDLSLGWLVTASACAMLWIGYGILAPAWAVLAGNVLPLAVVTTLAALKVSWGRSESGDVRR
jgi:MtN3 and saliva related transmembrane protein